MKWEERRVKWMVSTTTNDPYVAKKIAKEAIKGGFSPCVKIIPNVTSYYTEQQFGDIVESKEYVVNIKTLRINIKRLIRDIKKNHNYKIAELIAYKIDINATKNYDSDYDLWFSQNVIEHDGR